MPLRSTRFRNSDRLARNPDDDLRRLERDAARGDPQAQAAFALARHRAGHHVEPWELNPISYVLLAGYQSLYTDKPIKVELTFMAVLTEGGVQISQEFERKIAVYVYPARYPYRLPPRLHVADTALEHRQHRAAVDHAVSLGAIRVVLPFDEDTRSSYEDPERQDYRDFYDAYRMRVLAISPDIRIARPGRGEGWGGREPNPVIPANFVRARLMRKVGKNWKNNPGKPSDTLE